MENRKKLNKQFCTFTKIIIMTIYLDLNIFDRLEKIDALEEEAKNEYTNLLTLISNDNVEVPYSNAHLNDLLRGWKKIPLILMVI